MEWYWWGLMVVGWAACAVFTHGWSFAYLQGRFPLIAEDMYWKDLGFCALMALAGPLSLLCFCLTAFDGDGKPWYGFKLF